MEKEQEEKEDIMRKGERENKREGERNVKKIGGIGGRGKKHEHTPCKGKEGE